MRDLAAFLTRSPPPRPRSPSPIASEPRQPPRVQLRDSPVPRVDVVSDVPPTPVGPRAAPTPRIASPRVIEISPPQAVSLSRSTSNASSIESYLSSHHSDDDILEEDGEWPITRSLQVEDDDDVIAGGEPPSSPTSSSTFSSTPESSPSTMSSSESTARPITPPDVEEDRTLFDIKNKLDVLEDGQKTARELLERLGEREYPIPEDHTPELVDRMQRIEDILRDLLDQGHPRGPPLVFDIPPSVRPESMGSTSSSLGRLASILRNIASDEERPRIHVPLASREGPSMVEQLDDILSSSTHLTPSGGVHAPNLVPFTYRAVERGQRPRSASPRSMDNLPARPTTVPIPYPRTGRPASRIEQPRPRTQRAPRAAPSETETVRTPAPSAPRLPAREEEPTMMRNLPPSQEPPRETFHGGPGPTPRPVFVRRLFNI